MDQNNSRKITKVKDGCRRLTETWKIRDGTLIKRNRAIKAQQVKTENLVKTECPLGKRKVCGWNVKKITRIKISLG